MKKPRPSGKIRRARLGYQSGTIMSRIMTTRGDPESVTAHEALELAEYITEGVQAQLEMAAWLLHLEYGSFIEKLAREVDNSHAK